MAALDPRSGSTIHMPLFCYSGSKPASFLFCQHTSWRPAKLSTVVSTYSSASLLAQRSFQISRPAGATRERDFDVIQNERDGYKCVVLSRLGGRTKVLFFSLIDLDRIRLLARGWPKVRDRAYTGV